MSPLFHRDDDGPGDTCQARVISPLCASSARGWMKSVASQITSMVAVDTICWDLLPDNSGEHAGEPVPDAFFVLQDLVTEAVQLLQTAGLVMQRSYKVNQGHAYSQWLNGLVTTRRGRAALADGSVGQILGRVYAPPA